MQRLAGIRVVTIAVLALAFTAGRGEAQVIPGQFSLTPNVGYIFFDGASALEDAPVVGMDALYQVSSLLGVGLHLMVSRPLSDGTFFPPARHEHQDTTFLFTVSQQVTVLNVGGLANLGVDLGMVNLSALGGVGGYIVFLDPQVNRDKEDFRGLSVTVGAAAQTFLTERTGISLGIRNEIFTNFDRERLNPVHPSFQDPVWLELRGDTPEEKEVIHNLRLSLGFTYVPGGR